MSARHCVLIVLAGIFPYCPLEGQQAEITGPVTGFVFDAPSRSIRPILGTPGAAHLGAPTIEQIDWATVAPDGKLALAVKGGKLHLAQLRDSTSPTLRLLEGAIESPDQIVWSRNSSTAVIHSTRDSRLQWITGLAGGPTLSLDLPALANVLTQDTPAPHADAKREFPLQRITGSHSAPLITQPLDVSSLGGTLAVLAVDSAARQVILSVRSSSHGGVYRVSRESTPVLLWRSDDVVSATLADSSNALYVIDRATKEVLICRDVFGSGAVVPFLGEQDGVSDPVGIAASRDGESLFVADRTRQSILVYSIPSGSLVAEIQLDSPPSLVAPLSSTSFLLNARQTDSDPVLLLETRPRPAAFFVPAAP